MYGAQTYLTATDLVSSWGPTNWGDDNAGTNGAVDGNGYAGAAVTWLASTATANALIYTTANVGFTTAEAASLAEANTAIDPFTADTAMYGEATTQLF